VTVHEPVLTDMSDSRLYRAVAPFFTLCLATFIGSGLLIECRVSKVGGLLSQEG
jgi:hypothetical protein